MVRELATRFVAWFKAKREERRESVMFERQVLVEHGEVGVRVAYPQGATGEQAMLGLLQSRLAGFRDEAVILAMGCTDNARFVCWTRGDDLAPPAVADQR